MKLNNDCIRDILLFVEDQELNTIKDARQIYKGVNGEYTEDEILYALKNLIDLGYLEGRMISASDKILNAYIQEISATGHQYLETIRSPKAWAYAKGKAAEVGSFSLKSLGMFAQQYAKNWMDGQL